MGILEMNNAVVGLMICDYLLAYAHLNFLLPVYRSSSDDGVDFTRFQVIISPTVDKVTII